MSSRFHIYLLSAILFVVGAGLTLYKHIALDFPIVPGSAVTVWKIQGRIQLEAEGSAVTVEMILPKVTKSKTAILTDTQASEYDFQVIENDGIRKALWTHEKATGEQVLYIGGDIFREQLPKPDLKSPEGKPEDVLEGQAREAAQQILMSAHEGSADQAAFILSLLELMNKDSNDADVKMLLNDTVFKQEQLEVVSSILAIEGIRTRISRGLRLEGEYTQRSISSFIEYFDGDRWMLLDPKKLEPIDYDLVLFWPEGTRSLLDVYGGKNSSVDFTVSSNKMSAGQLAVESAERKKSVLVNFSIYSLPVHDQNTFKLLLLIPLGALVVVILRNLVGIRTSGTFMPVLIALTFIQTTLIVGLLLFLVIVGIGLLMRSYLSRLDLLLVPRIAAVLVFVIIIFAAIGITSHKLGWESGLAVTLFPMIILSWTIERMSILWEEEGPREVLIQGSGSLLTASLAYLLMINSHVKHIAFNFPEMLLVILAIIIMIGSYNGYRLLELRRFEPMTRE
jgi:hypothetical protein